PAAVQTTFACTEVGNFSNDEAQRFAAVLGDLAQRAQRRPVQAASSYMVYMPPQPDREGAERKAAELRSLGIHDFFIIQDNSALRWGISLGVFKTEEGARTHLAGLSQKGVRSARIGERGAGAALVAFQFADLDEGARATLEQATAGMRQTVKDCP
ncbi:MAG TPA: SPOR domain-containing protein, partial [Noviherbaspirillum sp.]|nr:SPOR domain-containing protein [Noviherbaspirillum sp.]